MEKWNELKQALLDWRAAEKKVEMDVLRAAYTTYVSALHDAERRALQKLRALVDSEPWSEIEQNLPSHSGAVAPLVPTQETLDYARSLEARAAELRNKYSTGPDEKTPTARAEQ